MEIKAIETEYNGYKFRSRLEARWAVFFDSLGMNWKYEVEGFETENGERYLPDFYLSDSNIYVEVKGNPQEAGDDFERMKKFIARDSSIQKILILPDIPPVRGSCCYYYNLMYYSGLHEQAEIIMVPILANREDDGSPDAWIGFDYSNTWHTRELQRSLYECALNLCNRPFAVLDDDLYEWDEYRYKRYNRETKKEIEYPLSSLCDDVLIEAYTKARQARFEHGETPEVIK